MMNRQRKPFWIAALGQAQNIAKRFAHELVAVKIIQAEIPQRIPDDYVGASKAGIKPSVIECGSGRRTTERTDSHSNSFEYDGRDIPGNRRHAQELDRKSTRLNSSHSQISYAVFCL